MPVRDHGFIYKSLDEAAADNAILYSSDVARFTGLKVPAIRRRSTDPADDFPAPSKISLHRYIWHATEIKAWLDSRHMKKGK